MRSIGHTSLAVTAALIQEGAHEDPVHLNFVAFAKKLEMDRAQLYHCLHALARRGIVKFEPGFQSNGIEITSVGLEILEYYISTLDPLIRVVHGRRTQTKEKQG